MAYQKKDAYHRAAKQEGRLARSSFKLEELDQKYGLFKRAQSVLDLGAAPGSWSQYASSRIANSGKVLALDLEPLAQSLPNVVPLIWDMRLMSPSELKERLEYEKLLPLDLVLSDMAPKTTGIRVTDHMRSLELCQLALEIAHLCLKPGGHFVCKFFDGEEFVQFRSEVKAHFQRLEILRPKSTRKESKEIYFVGLQKLSPRP